MIITCFFFFSFVVLIFQKWRGEDFGTVQVQHHSGTAVQPGTYTAVVIIAEECRYTGNYIVYD